MLGGTDLTENDIEKVENLIIDTFIHGVKEHARKAIVLLAMNNGQNFSEEMIEGIYIGMGLTMGGEFALEMRDHVTNTILASKPKNGEVNPIATLNESLHERLFGDTDESQD